MLPYGRIYFLGFRRELLLLYHRLTEKTISRTKFACRGGVSPPVLSLKTGSWREGRPLPYERLILQIAREDNTSAEICKAAGASPRPT